MGSLTSSILRTDYGAEFADALDDVLYEYLWGASACGKPYGLHIVKPGGLQLAGIINQIVGYALSLLASSAKRLLCWSWCCPLR